MPTFYASLAPETPTVRNRMNATERNADIRFAESVYTATGTEAASGDNINVVTLPVGAQVIPELCTVSNEASMGGSVLAIPTLGDAVDADRYSATSISIHSSNAAIVAVTPAVGTSVIPRHTITEATRTVVAAFTRTNAMTAGKKILFRIAYRLGH